jgi:hypothetical protein
MNEKLNFSNEHEILLLDSSIQIEELKLLKKIPKIITFDFESHKLLLKNNISHEISDEYLTKQDLCDIQNKSYDFIKWYNDPTISNFIEYEQINLGELVIGEFHLYLVPFLKKFAELLIIYKKYPNAEFFTTFNLHPFIFTLTNSVKIINTNKKFERDTSPQMKYGLKLGTKHLTISLSQKYYKKIKFFSEIFINMFFPNKITNNNKNILLIEFGASRNRHFFYNLPNSNINVILHNRRLPSIWNFDTYSILKKSKCIVTTFHGLLDNKVKHSIDFGKKSSSSQIDELWKHDLFFKTFFSFNKISFWSILKPFFKNMLEKRIPDYVTEIELTKKLFNQYNFSSILVMSENGPIEQIAISLAKKFKIKVALIQHGLYDDTAEAFDFNNLSVLPRFSDKFLVWGETLKNYALNCGISAEKIEIVGSPTYDDFFLKTKNSDFNDSFILLATTNPIDNLIFDLTISSQLQREQAIQKICQTVTKLNKKMIIKLHTNPDEIDITDFVHQINSEITVVKAGNILDLMKNCTVFITLNSSTTILESQICMKPSISVSVTDRGFGNSEVFKSQSCIKINNNQIEDTLLKLLNDDTFKKKIIEDSKKFSDTYLHYQGNSSQRLLAFLENF